MTFMMGFARQFGRETFGSSLPSRLLWASARCMTASRVPLSRACNRVTFELLSAFVLYKMTEGLKRCLSSTFQTLNGRTLLASRPSAWQGQCLPSHCYHQRLDYRTFHSSFLRRQEDDETLREPMKRNPQFRWNEPVRFLSLYTRWPKGFVRLL